jgi:hypothetical protein
MRAETDDFRKLYPVFDYTIVIDSVPIARDVLSTPIVQQNLRRLTLQLGPDLFDLRTAMEVAKSCSLLRFVSIMCDSNDFPVWTGLFVPYYDGIDTLEIKTRNLKRLLSLPQAFDIHFNVIENQAGFSSDPDASTACWVTHYLIPLGKADAVDAVNHMDYEAIIVGTYWPWYRMEQGRFTAEEAQRNNAHLRSVESNPDIDDKATDKDFGLTKRANTWYCKDCRWPHNLEELNKDMSDHPQYRTFSN